MEKKHSSLQQNLLTFFKKLLKRLKAALFVILLPSVLYGHDNWITAEKYYANPGDKIRLQIGCGHDFPSSDTVISKKLVEKIKVKLPEGKKKTLEINTDSVSNTLWAALKLDSTGTYIASYKLQRPQMENPVAYGSTVIICREDSGIYVNGEGPEIAPLEKLSRLGTDDNIMLGLFNGGKRVGGSLNIYPPYGRSYRMRTAESRAAEIKTDIPGKYLVTARIEGIDLSFTFLVPERENENN